MSFAKTFGQRHVLRFLSSHIDLSGCRITAASPAGLRVTDGVHKLCLKSTDGCIQREDDPNSVAPEIIEVYGSTARRTAVTKRGGIEPDAPQAYVAANCGIAGKPLASLSLTPAALRC